MKTKISAILALIMSLVLTGCGQGQSVEPTITSVQISTPTLTPAPTKTPVPTASPTHTPHTPDSEAVKLLEEAFSFSKKGEDEKAIEAYTKAIEVDPLYGQPYFNRGAIYADHRELEKALADFTKGLEVDPTNPHGYSLRANILIELDKIDEALEDIKSILNLTKDEAYIKMALTSAGHVYSTQDEPFLALAAYTAALDIDEHFTPALISRGQIYFNQKDWLRAFSDLTLVLQATDDPELRDAIIDILMGVYPEGTTVDKAMAASKVHFDQGMALREKGDYASSTESVSKAIDIDPLNADFYFIRGLNLANDGDLLKAITDISFSIALLPNDPRGYYWRGLMESDLGMATESIADMEKALEFDLDSDTKTRANQVLKDMRLLQKSCQFTTFETVNNAEKPTFKFTFVGPPNTDFVVAALSKATGAGGGYPGCKDSSRWYHADRNTI